MKRFDPTRWRVPLGFAMAAIFLLLARPTPVTLAFGLGVAALGLWLRAYASGHIQKNDRLAVSGPYRCCRNPLYFGSLLLAAGLLLAAARWELAVLAVAFYLTVYLPVIRREEVYLSGRFGTEFEEYARRVPRIWPRWPVAADAGPQPSFSWRLYRRHREYQALVGFCAVAAVLMLKCRFGGFMAGW